MNARFVSSLFRQKDRFVLSTQQFFQPPSRCGVVTSGNGFAEMSLRFRQISGLDIELSKKMVRGAKPRATAKERGTRGVPVHLT